MLGLGIAGCSLLFPFDGYGPGTAEVDAADAAPPLEASAPEAATGCVPAHWPERPAADDPSSGDVDLTFAVERLDLGLSDDASAPIAGRDLDGLCTCPDAPPCTSATTSCDQDGGVDNGIRGLLQALSAYGPVVDQTMLDTYLDQGAYMGFLLQLKRYNGTPNDRSVQFSAYRSDGTVLDDAGSNIRPRKDGTDQWTIDPDSLVGGSGPPYLPTAVDTNAYVANGLLVARANVPVVFPNGGNALPLKVEEGVVLGRLVREGAKWRIDQGTFAGRISTRILLTAFQAIPDPFNKGHTLCGPSKTYQALKPQVCAAAEITAFAATDNQGHACNAFSFGIGYTAVQAQLGGLGLSTLDSGLPCGPDYTDDCTP
jgi:hypothetical protein